MLTLFKNPLLRLLGSFWWLPALLAVFLCGLAGAGGLLLLKAGLAAAGAIALAAAGAVGADVGLMTAGARLRARLLRHRFLCPRCLRFGPPRVRCGACKRPLSRAFLDTGGAYCRSCPECSAPLFPGLVASCEGCAHDAALSRLHRSVRVIGVLAETDFELLRSGAGAGTGVSNGLRHFTLDNGGRLTCFLNLADLPLPERTAAPRHALRSLDALWLRDPEAEPLQVGRTVDCLLRQAGSPAGRRWAIPVYAPGGALGPPVRALLTARFGPPRSAPAAQALLAASGTLPSGEASP